MKKLYSILAATMLSVPSLFALEAPEMLFVVGPNNGDELPGNGGPQDILWDNGEGIYEGTVVNNGTSDIFSFYLFTDPEATSYTQGVYIGGKYAQDFKMVANEPCVIDVGFKGYGGSLFTVTGFTPGAVAVMTVDWAAETITMLSDLYVPDTPQPSDNVFYLTGAPTGWDESDTSMSLEWNKYNNDAYVGTLYIPAGEFDFRFNEMIDGNIMPIGANTNNVNEPYDISSDGQYGMYAGFTMYGGPAWIYPEWEGGWVEITFYKYDDYIMFNLLATPPDNPTPEENVIYLVGDMQGWNIHDSDLKLTFNEQTYAFEGTFHVGANDYFRFYRQLATPDQDWADIAQYSLGAKVDENDNVNVAFNNGIYTSPLYYPGLGCWHMTGWNGGEVFMQINLGEDDYVVFEVISEDEPSASGPECLYVRGSMNNWEAQSDWAIYPSESNPYLYSGIFNMAAGGFEFKIADASWGTYNYGAASNEAGLFDLVSINSFESPLTYNGSNFNCAAWNGGEIEVAVTMDAEWKCVSMTVSAAGSGIASSIADNGVRYNDGLVTVSDATQITVVNMAGQKVAGGFGKEINLRNLPAGIYVVKAEGFAPVKIVK